MSGRPEKQAARGYLDIQPKMIYINPTENSWLKCRLPDGTCVRA